MCFSLKVFAPLKLIVICYLCKNTLELEGDVQNDTRISSAKLNTISASEVYLQDVEMQNLDSTGRQVTGDLLLGSEDCDVAAMRPTWRHQIAALVMIRCLSEWRMKGQAFLRIIIPVVVMIYGILVSNAANNYYHNLADVQALSLDAGLYSYVESDRRSYSNPKTLLMAQSVNGKY
jgi:hypothetical protein